MEGDRTGQMIIRAWTEPGSTEPLRAEVRIVCDASAGVERRLTFCRADAVCATVREWLDGISGDLEPPA